MKAFSPDFPSNDPFYPLEFARFSAGFDRGKSIATRRLRYTRPIFHSNVMP
jgi:hypothetical protein